MKFTLATSAIAVVVGALLPFFSEAEYTRGDRLLKKSSKSSSSSCDLPDDVDVAGCYFGDDDSSSASSTSSHELEELLCSGKCAYQDFFPGLEFHCLGGSNEHMLISDLRDPPDRKLQDETSRRMQVDGRPPKGDGGPPEPPEGPSYCCPNTCGKDILNRADCYGPFYSTPPNSFGGGGHGGGGKYDGDINARHLGEEEADGGGSAVEWEERQDRQLGGGNEGMCNDSFGDVLPAGSGFGFYEVAVGLSGDSVALYCCEANDDDLLPSPSRPPPYV